MSSCSMLTLFHLQINCYNWDQKKKEKEERNTSTFAFSLLYVFHDSCKQGPILPTQIRLINFFVVIVAFHIFHQALLILILVLQIIPFFYRSAWLSILPFMFYITHQQAFCETCCGLFVTLPVLPQQGNWDLKCGVYINHGIWSPSCLSFAILSNSSSFNTGVGTYCGKYRSMQRLRNV